MGRYLPGAAIGLLFMYAGAMKALDPGQFAGDIENFRLVPHHAAVLLAIYLPWLEVICGFALLINRLRAGALCIFTTLCLVFLAALVSAKMRGLDISCGCFGHAHPHSLTTSLVTDSLLLFLLVLLLLHEFKAQNPKS
jgi:uncharacterized membrane protein YphA (DoxX/SURF4 family)